LIEGVDLPLENGTVDVAYSNQVMEHLHPDDARQQLRNIYRVLKNGARYICVTPNRLTGPHDISQYFDSVASGFHLKEYSISELCALMLEAGFTRVSACYSVRGAPLMVAAKLVGLLERLLGRLPRAIRNSYIGSHLVCHQVIATK
jgi:SAM-dependent methyltransferase